MPCFRCVIECNYLPMQLLLLFFFNQVTGVVVLWHPVLRRLLTVAGDRRKVLSLSEDKAARKSDWRSLKKQKSHQQCKNYRKFLWKLRSTHRYFPAGVGASASARVRANMRHVLTRTSSRDSLREHSNLWEVRQAQKRRKQSSRRNQLHVCAETSAYSDLPLNLACL